MQCKNEKHIWLVVEGSLFFIYFCLPSAKRIYAGRNEREFHESRRKPGNIKKGANGNRRNLDCLTESIKQLSRINEIHRNRAGNGRLSTLINNNKLAFSLNASIDMRGKLIM